jgi:hypothetical protein
VEAWVGPVIIAALVSGLVSVFGWSVAYRQSLELEQRRRQEKIHDFLIALRAEIRGELKDLNDFNQTDEMLTRIRENYDRNKDYSVTVPSVTPHVVFEAIVSNIHILPEEVIDDVVLYHAQHNAIARLAEDTRVDRFRSLSPEYQMQMYEDYLNMRAYQHTLANDAVEKLQAAIAASISIPRAWSGLSHDGFWSRWRLGAR